MALKWRKTLDGYMTEYNQTVIRLRGPLNVFVRNKPVKKMWWLYIHQGRYSPTGGYADAVHFMSLTAAKKYVEKLVKSKTARERYFKDRKHPYHPTIW